jgi:hypothetical protein
MALQILTVLVVLLVVAFVVAVVYPVLRIVYEIIVFRRKERRPKPQIVHPQLGLLVHDESLWSGQTDRGQEKLYFCIKGGPEAPDEGLVAALQDKLASIDRWERTALDFLCRDERLDPEPFTLESLDFLWEDKPDSFVLEFSLEGDPDGIWRVEFEDNQPAYTGRDD